MELISVCNCCGKKYLNEPDRCECGEDDFGMEEVEDDNNDEG